jgi:hypothetical protein
VRKTEPGGTDVMIFKIFLPKNSAKKLPFFTRNKAKLCKILIITLVFEKNAIFLSRKMAKIAENCDRNINPWFYKQNSVPELAKPDLSLVVTETFLHLVQASYLNQISVIKCC